MDPSLLHKNKNVPVISTKSPKQTLQLQSSLLILREKAQSPLTKGTKDIYARFFISKTAKKETVKISDLITPEVSPREMKRSVSQKAIRSPNRRLVLQSQGAARKKKTLFVQTTFSNEIEHTNTSIEDQTMSRSIVKSTATKSTADLHNRLDGQITALTRDPSEKSFFIHKPNLKLSTSSHLKRPDRSIETLKSSMLESLPSTAMFSAQEKISTKSKPLAFTAEFNSDLKALVHQRTKLNDVTSLEFPFNASSAAAHNKSALTAISSYYISPEALKGQSKDSRISNIQTLIKHKDINLHVIRNMSSSTKVKTKNSKRERPETSIVTDSLMSGSIQQRSSLMLNKQESSPRIRESRKKSQTLMQIDDYNQQIFVQNEGSGRRATSREPTDMSNRNSHRSSNKSRRALRSLSRKGYAEKSNVTENYNLTAEGKNDDYENKKLHEIIQQKQQDLGEKADQALEAEDLEAVERVVTTQPIDEPANKVEDVWETRQKLENILCEVDSGYAEEVKQRRAISMKQSAIGKNSSAIDTASTAKISAECSQTKSELDVLKSKITTMLIKKKEVRKDRDVAGFLSDNAKTLNELEITTIKQEYSKPPEDRARNYMKLDRIMHRLKYFSKLSEPVRLALIKCGFYAHYSAGDIVFNQGDYGDLLYIILRGSVNVRVKTKTSYGTTENMVVAVLYDGSHFGDYAITMISDKDKGPNQQKHQKDVFEEMAKRVEEKHPELKNSDWRRMTSPKKALKGTPSKNSLPTEGDQPKEKKPAEQKEDTKKIANTKRAATIEAAESCDMLCIPKDDLHQIFVTLVQKEVDFKLKILSNISFLAAVNRLALIPLANNLTSTTYKIGEVILNAGEPVDKFRIILKGRCKLIHKMVRENDCSLDKLAIQSSKNFASGLADYSCKETATTQFTKIFKDGNKHENKTEFEGRSFNFEKIKADENKILYLQHMAFATLLPGHFFGSRALLDEEDFKDDKLITEDVYPDHLLGRPAQLSVIADAAVVEVLDVDKERLKYIPQALLGIFKKGIKLLPEFDDFDLNKFVKRDEDWLYYKKKFISGNLQNKVTPYVDACD